MKRFYFAAAVAALFFTGCATEETVEPTPEKALLTFNSVLQADMTRAAKDLGASFKFNLSAVTDVYEAQNDLTATYNSTDKKYTTATDIWLYKTERNLTAWAPVGISAKAAETPNVFDLTAAAYTADADLVYQPNKAVSSTNAEVSLTFEHAYAKVSFELVATNYHGKKHVTSLVITGMPATGTIDITTGTVTPAAPDADVTVVNADTDFATAEVSALVIPSTPTALKVNCTLDGVEYKGIEIKDVTSFEKGKHYTIKLTATDKSLSFLTIQVNEWESVATPGTGTLE